MVVKKGGGGGGEGEREYVRMIKPTPLFFAYEAK